MTASLTQDNSAEVTIGVPRFSLSPTTAALVTLLSTTAPGYVFTHDEISESVGCPKDAWQPHIGTAKNILMGLHKIRIESVRGVGYKHVTDDEIANTFASKDVHGVAKKAGKARRAIVNGVKDPNKLPHGKLAVLQLVEHAASPRGVRILENTIAKNGDVSLGATMDALKRLK